MAEDALSSEFSGYWDIVVIKVEDKLFSVPRCEFVNSSEVFADMFNLPSGSAAPKDGQDEGHPIVLEGYKKDEFTSLLKVMYPTAGSLISDTKVEFCLEKDEWVSVLKLSTIWNMKKIRKYAIHKLSTDVVLSPVEKILLARAHKVAAWRDEGVTSLVMDPELKFEDLVTLGWETAARILWILSKTSLSASNTLHFRRDDIECASCSSSLINYNYNCPSCGVNIPADAEFPFPCSGFPSGNTDRLVPFSFIPCRQCARALFGNIRCNSCRLSTATGNCQVRITRSWMIKELMEMFGEEIEGSDVRGPASSHGPGQAGPD